MRVSVIGVVLCYMIWAGAELTLHWYIGTQRSPLASRLCELYFYRDPDNGKPYIMGLTVFLGPMLLMGLVAGILGSRWSPGRLALCVVILAFGTVALYPLYASFFPAKELFYWPADAVGRVTAPLSRWLFGGAFCGAVAYGARNATLFLQGERRES
jgi:hypothetical protein